MTTPDQEAASIERSAELVSVICAEIESTPSRRITFARFMELALYETRLGYYRQAADRPTDAGDFLTAPETHPIFGWTLARRIEEMWASLDRPDPFTILEYGAGSGTLALAVFEGFRRHGRVDLLEATRYLAVETNPHRVTELRRRFEEAGLADRLAGLEDRLAGGSATSSSSGVEPVSGVIIANEFLDALPVHRFVVRGGKLLELFVARREGARGRLGDPEGSAGPQTAAGFVEVVAEPSTPELAERLADDGIDVGRLAEGQVGEISLGLGEWLDETATRLGRGYALVIDYGHDAAELYGPRRLAGTLLGYRGHRVAADPLEMVGLADLTAHVDFTALRLLGERRGWRTAASATQSEFLVVCGLEAELQALQASADLTAPDYLRARSAIVRLLDPRHLGRFRVLTLARGVASGKAIVKDSPPR
jgi:SAM-dependent MidA family methyltransferase